MANVSSKTPPHLGPISVDEAPFRPTQDVLKIGGVTDSSLEPEERPVARFISINPSIALGGKPLSAINPDLAKKQMPGQIVQDLGSAGLVAQSLKSRCGMCVHWDHEKGQRLIQKEADAEAFGKPAADIFRLVQRRQALFQMGFCKALTSAMGAKRDEDGWITPQSGGCPDIGHVFTPSGEDVAKLDLYKQRDRVSDHRGDTAYDMILRTASGKK